MLKWLNEPTDTFVIATANNIEGLPPEYLRAGRWDGIFFVDVPSAKEQKDILSIYLKKYHNMGIDDLEEFPDITNFTGAEIKQLCIEAAYNGGDWFEAANYVKPIAVTRKSELNKLRKWAEVNCINASSAVKIKPVKNGSIEEPHLQDFCRTVSM